MADNSFNNTVESLFKGNGQLYHNKDRSRRCNSYRRYDYSSSGRCIFWCCGRSVFTGKENMVPRYGWKINPSAVLVIQNGVTKLVNIKNQDGMTKILDMVPDFINKFTSGKDTDDIIDDVVSDDTDNE